MNSNFIKIASLILLLNTFLIYAELSEKSDSQIDTSASSQNSNSTGLLKSGKSSVNRFSLSFGGGRYFNFAGISAKYDRNRFGADFSIGAIGFPDLSLSIRRNSYRKNGLIVLSPGLTLFFRDRPFINYHDEDMVWGLSLNLDLRTYLGKSFYLINNFGIECIVKDNELSYESILPAYHSGIGFGFTFGGAPLSRTWIEQSKKSTVVLAVTSTILNIILTPLLYIIPLFMYGVTSDD